MTQRNDSDISDTARRRADAVDSKDEAQRRIAVLKRNISRLATEANTFGNKNKNEARAEQRELEDELYVLEKNLHKGAYDSDDKRGDFGSTSVRGMVEAVAGRRDVGRADDIPSALDILVMMVGTAVAGPVLLDKLNNLLARTSDPDERDEIEKQIRRARARKDSDAAPRGDDLSAITDIMSTLLVGYVGYELWQMNRAVDDLTELARKAKDPAERREVEKALGELKSKVADLKAKKLSRGDARADGMWDGGAFNFGEYAIANWVDLGIPYLLVKMFGGGSDDARGDQSGGSSMLGGALESIGALFKTSPAAPRPQKSEAAARSSRDLLPSVSPIGESPKSVGRNLLRMIIGDCFGDADDKDKTEPKYNAEAVNKAIEASNRAGRKIGGKEARLIHSLLKGRGDDAMADSARDEGARAAARGSWVNPYPYGSRDNKEWEAGFKSEAYSKPAIDLTKEMEIKSKRRGDAERRRGDGNDTEMLEADLAAAKAELRAAISAKDQRSIDGLKEEIAMIENAIRLERNDSADPRAAALSQGGVPNIAAAKVIENAQARGDDIAGAIKKLAEDVPIGSPPPMAPGPAIVDQAPPITPAPGVAAMPDATPAPAVAPVRAAGIMFVTDGGMALFVKRAAGSDHAGEWCFPGGVIEGTETAEQAAIREAGEEVEWTGDEPLEPWTRRNRDGVDFTTFLAKLPEPFGAAINAEHVGVAWAPVNDPPRPLHPGCEIALAKLGMDELGVARAMAAGDLTSPQRYRNMWLFDLRITGTGYAFRSKLNEFTYRRPENYLTQDYLDRCNGLPVIMMHPDEVELNSKEFSDRVVGAMMLPYFKNDEVWGIARIYDDDAAAMMQSVKLSTSPGVILRKSDGARMTMEDGKALLIEGKPVLMDHLAICENGVWDKGDAPNGVRVDTDQEMAMADENKTVVKTDKKSDADGGTVLDKVLAKMDEDKKDLDKKFDAMSKRMDNIENLKKGDSAKKDADDKDGKKDADDPAAKKADEDDKSKKDNDEKKPDNDDKSKDEKKGDAQISVSAKDWAAMQQRVNDLASAVPRRMTDADYHQFADVQARADSVFVAHGQRAPRPLDGEPLGAYRRRMAKALKAHSVKWKDVAVEAIADDATFANIETEILADAAAAARNPANVPADTLRAVQSVDRTGRTITDFFGQPRAWMSQFSAVPRRVQRISNGSPRPH